MNAPYQAIRCADGYITLGAANDRLFRRLCEILGHSEWLERAEFRHRQSSTAEGVVRRISSVSHVAVLPQDERAAVLDEVRAVLATHPDVAGRDVVEIPYRVDCIAVPRV